MPTLYIIYKHNIIHKCIILVASTMIMECINSNVEHSGYPVSPAVTQLQAFDTQLSNPTS